MVCTFHSSPHPHPKREVVSWVLCPNHADLSQPVCGTASFLLLQRAAKLSLTLHGLQQLKVCRLPVSGQSGRTDSSPSGSPPKVRTLDTFQSFPPKGDTSSWTFPPSPPKPGQLKGGAIVVDMKWLSYPF